VTKEHVLSGSWDNTIKLWHPDLDRSVRTFAEHTHCVYSAVWHPRHADMFASTSGDGFLKVWDSNHRKSIHSVKAHDHEVGSLL
jgi:peroxin-7